MKKTKIGLLPLYIELYDQSAPSLRKRLEAFYEEVAKEFESRGFDVMRVPFCRLVPEFEAAVKKFEDEKSDVIVTLHMAYSPSLMSSDALAKTKLPIIVMDTTDTPTFGFDQDPDDVSYCHGIHGVMDMCNLLKRNGKPYAIAAGHYKESDVFERVAGYIKAAKAATSLNGTKVGTVGGSFEGMGDFLVSDEEMKNRFGVEVVYSNGPELAKIYESIDEKDVEKEIAKDNKFYTPINKIDPEVHKMSTRTCLAVRKWIKKEKLDAFTVNFLAVSPSDGIPTMPFMEACKEMANGIGYAGEGDVLTAAITGAFIRGYKDATFAEIFCPDWRGGRLFISHMGEFNNDLVAKKPEMKQLRFIYGRNAKDPVVGYGCYKPGKAVYVNVCRDAEKYNLVIAPIEMLDAPGEVYQGKVRGWFKPNVSTAEFLESLSRAGATHHSSIIYGATEEEMIYFAELLGLNPIVIK